MACAVDFTISNGEPLTQDSLHTNDEEKVSSRFVKGLKRVLKGVLSFDDGPFFCSRRDKRVPFSSAPKQKQI